MASSVSVRQSPSGTRVAPKASLWRANRLLRIPDEQVQRCDRFARALAESSFLQQVRKEVRAETDMRLEDLARGFDLRAAELAELRAHHSRKVRTGDITAQARLTEVKSEQSELQEERAGILCGAARAELLDIVSFERIAVGLVIPDDSAEARDAYDKNIEAIAVRVPGTSKQTGTTPAWWMCPRRIWRRGTILKATVRTAISWRSRSKVGPAVALFN